MKATARLWIVTAFAGGVAIGALVVHGRLADRLAQLEARQQALLKPTSKNTGKPPTAQPVGRILTTNAFFNAAAESQHAVVYISTRSGYAQNFFDDAYRFPQRGSGSGVVLSKDGYIVTNHHVVEGAEDILVTLSDNAEYDAEVVAADPSTDLAVIKITPLSPLDAIRFADSDAAQVGQWVLAIGNPFNLTSTVTTGIISAKARNIGVLRNQFNLRSGADYSIESFIQTDAVVNPGNSGGALVNLDGELVGINTAIATQTGSYQGYSFAIPSNLVKKVTGDLIRFGVVQRGFIGVSIRDLDSRIAMEEDIKTRNGAYVTELTPEGAAEAAGLEVGDVIIAVEDRAVQSASELQEQIALKRPGDIIKLRVLRKADTLDFRVKLRNKNGQPALLQPANWRRPVQDRFGADFHPLPAQEQQRLELSEGARVAWIQKNGPMDRAGVPLGFVITHLDKRRISGPTDLMRRLEETAEMAYFEGHKPNGRKAYYIVDLRR